jgi:hypothetical protein
MTHDEFREAVDSLGDKFLAAITSQRPINVSVTLAAAFHMIGALVEATPEDERPLVEVPLRQGLEELLQEWTPQRRAAIFLLYEP